jgi:hypothetical protein
VRPEVGARTRSPHARQAALRPPGLDGASSYAIAPPQRGHAMDREMRGRRAGLERAGLERAGLEALRGVVFFFRPGLREPSRAGLREPSRSSAARVRRRSSDRTSSPCAAWAILASASTRR